MNSMPNKADEPRSMYTADAIPEDDETQEELNRRFRKPGEPGYCPPNKTSPAVNSQPGGSPNGPATKSP